MIRALAVLAVLAAIVAIGAAFAPASLLAQRVADASGGLVRLADARGTVWSGEATLSGRDGRWSLPVRWRLEALPLLRGEAKLELLPADAAPGLRGRLTARGGTLDARDVEASVPAAALPLPGGVAASGEVRVAADALRVGGGRDEGTLRLDWPQARIAVDGIGPLDLGTATATLAADGTRWRGPLRVRGGMLHVDGEASVDAGGADIALSIVPQPHAPRVLRQWLPPADATGAVKLRLAPRFR
ncbi:MAG: hypothetical protein BroJett026_32740 [Betaproteobacteria bacterium]|nr:MAG: hypothetical protein BroJett026_32740 [Betaproteobacteria bacterium]